MKARLRSAVSHLYDGDVGQGVYPYWWLPGVGAAAEIHLGAAAAFKPWRGGHHQPGDVQAVSTPMHILVVAGPVAAWAAATRVLRRIAERKLPALRRQVGRGAAATYPHPGEMSMSRSESRTAAVTITMPADTALLENLS
jgi:hypothetical protein